jgi:hypothetical protein
MRWTLYQVVSALRPITVAVSPTSNWPSLLPPVLGLSRKLSSETSARAVQTPVWPGVVTLAVPETSIVSEAGTLAAAPLNAITSRVNVPWRSGVQLRMALVGPV